MCEKRQQIVLKMERIKQKTRKEKIQKHSDKDSSSTGTFITDVKSFKENLKIKELLRTVKMNSSMRVKAPRGSKVMNNKDFNDNDDLFEEGHNSNLPDQRLVEPSPSATNCNVIIAPKDIDNTNTKTEISDDAIVLKLDIIKKIPSELKDEHYGLPKETDLVECIELNYADEPSTDVVDYNKSQPSSSEPVTPEINFLDDNTQFKNRDRKLSLDHTLLTRREGLSQSELDLYSIGKSPLERKSSFFRKKMESFFKNTTEIFKRQSLGSKPQSVQRRGSMSVSLQSLNENPGEYKALLKNNQGSTRSLQSSSTVGRSTSSLSTSQHAAASEVDSLAGSQPLLSASQPIGDITSDSAQNLNEDYAQDSLLNARAISMSSGLDSAHTSRRRKSSNRTNRVTWVASEGLSHYFRRLIQDEKSKEMQVCHSYSDFTTIPENALCGPRLDSRGRRLSYQRAVSGEDPAPAPLRYDSSLRRRHLIPENSEANYELSNLLAEFTRNGVPPLKGFAIANISDESFAYLIWAGRSQNLEEFYDLKTLPAYEESRQAVIRELISTEAVHIGHLKSIVEVFIAAAHALQDAGKLLDIDTERLFSNIPDVLNASLIFWDSALYPMVADAVENSSPFNTELMSAGFGRFPEIFTPYEKFVSEQTKALDYLRSITHNTDFMMYLTWCHSQKECNRLQLADILVKPMQRLTKYSLILRRIITYTETEPERTSLIAMERFSKNYVLDLNRSIRQREELEKLDALANSIDSYEIDFKDEDLDRYFRMYSQLNLKAPMLNCVASHSRSIIYQGDLRYKDKEKEIEVRVFLLTDMMLITKKQSKGSAYPFKMIRPKFMVDKLIHFVKPHSRNPKDMVALIFVVVDDVGSAHNAFSLSDTQREKDPNAQVSLKMWDQKIKEAKMTYDLAVWFARKPSRDLTEMDMDSSSDYAVSGGRQLGLKQSSDDMNIEREARERVATMLQRSMGASTEYDFSQTSMNTESFDGNFIAVGEGSGASSVRSSGAHGLRHAMHRTSTGGSSRQSRISSFHQSASAASHEEPQACGSKNIYRTGSSVEHLIPPLNPDDNTVTSITVNVVGESESEEPEPPHAQAAQPPTPVRTGSRSPISSNTLRVHPQSGVLALVHSLPDLTVDPSPTRPSHSPTPQSASEKLYQSHQELLHRNRLSAASQQQHYLHPDHRGISYPPPSPTRASLKRGLAFSYSFKNPPLSKMGHVYSQSQTPAEQVFPASQHGKGERDTAVPPPPIVPPAPMLPPASVPAPSTDKPEKKSKQFLSRNKGGTSSSGGTANTSGASGTSGTVNAGAGAANSTAIIDTSGTKDQTCSSNTAGASDTAGTSGTVSTSGLTDTSGIPGTSGTADTASTAGPIDTSSTSDIATTSGTASTSGKAGSSIKASTSGKSSKDRKVKSFENNDDQVD